MRWADALRASRVGRATRELTLHVRSEPNMLLIDPAFDATTPKAFHVPPGESYGWKRVRLSYADDYNDWEPVEPRSAIEWLAKLG